MRWRCRYHDLIQAFSWPHPHCSACWDATWVFMVKPEGRTTAKKQCWQGKPGFQWSSANWIPTSETKRKLCIHTSLDIHYWYKRCTARYLTICGSSLKEVKIIQIIQAFFGVGYSLLLVPKTEDCSSHMQPSWSWNARLKLSREGILIYTGLKALRTLWIKIPSWITAGNKLKASNFSRERM